MRRADVAMYEAKRTASGYAHFDRDQEQRTNLRRVVVSELRHAIEQDQLVLHFQPKVALKTRAVTGLEALVRWDHPEGGLIPPERFIPLAEQTGLIEPMTWWVINSALRQLRWWQERGLSVPVTLNLTTRTLHDPELPNHFSFLTRLWHVPEESITVDITESSVMANPARTARMLQGLRSMGLHIAIDDFGTGYSSLSSLGRLPIEELKVDRSFIRTMVADPHDAAIVRAAIDLGHQLGLKVVAEGVEDQATCSLLEVLGCDQAQGHFFCSPLSSAEAEGWLREHANGLHTPSVT
jgi:EAL domain-containing protein (putative c-di-GMP-specific phosphodiesterase class I)